MKKGLFLSTIAAGAIAFAGSAFAAFPGVGDNPSGPQWLITFNADGSISTSMDPVYGASAIPYDGSDDAYFGVTNNTNHTVPSFTVSGPAIGGNELGWFDGDGIGANNLGTSVTVNFINPIAANGGTDIFSLETPGSLNFTVSPGVPEPATWAMMMGFAGLGFAGFRKAKKSAAFAM